ncbi:protein STRICTOSIDINE SYNTHASE-LIKE 12-like [Ipomoea triloba]|uniref:protein STRICTOSIDINE SYNTHASE-LIKE 12-like n=1 Tax=Ipomoea triloba TaxID=35885 RepID=UPI00125CD775|nr:protein STRICTOSIDINE SYNTHASE-LIKE 12-like [Ipomoea triloba]
MNSLALFWISILMFISSPCVVHPQPGINQPIKLNLPQNASGPEDFDCDPIDKGCYTGVSDGRIFKFFNNGTFSDFATTTPLRTKEKCDGISFTNVQAECGRPLGLYFDRRGEELYIADSFYGLLKVGKNGGLATQLAAGVDGRNFSFTNAVVVDEQYGDAYFVDSGAIFVLLFRTLDLTGLLQGGDISGRLLKYEAATGQVTVLLNGLSGPAGIAMGGDSYGTFLMISEFIGRKVIKYYITGPKANTIKTVLKNLPGFPDNIKKGATKGFWVAVSIPKLLPLQLPLPQTESIAVHFDMNGTILNTRNLTNGFPNTLSVYFESGLHNKAYAGSLPSKYVGLYNAI